MEFSDGSRANSSCTLLSDRVIAESAGLAARTAASYPAAFN
jgi:hypothetical protein